MAGKPATFSILSRWSYGVSDLIAFQNLTEPALVYASGAAEELIEKIKREARGRILDISTKKGREEIASLSYAVARVKTSLDNMGKAVIEEAQAKVNSVNAERRRIRDELDLLKDEIRAPLTKWENEEKARVEIHEQNIAALKTMAIVSDDYPAEDIRKRLNSIEALIYNWEEFQGRGEQARSNTIATLKAKLALREKYEAEKIELAQLRQAEIERQKAEEERVENERINAIAAEAAEKARRAAEEKAAADLAEQKRKTQEQADAAEREQKRLVQEKADAEKRAAEAEAREIAAAEQRRLEAIENEKRIAREKADAIAAREKELEEAARIKSEKERAEQQRRDEDEAHRASINKKVIAAMRSVDEFLGENQAQAILDAMAKGVIPHVKIIY